MSEPSSAHSTSSRHPTHLSPNLPSDAFSQSTSRRRSSPDDNRSTLSPLSSPTPNAPRMRRPSSPYTLAAWLIRLLRSPRKWAGAFLFLLVLGWVARGVVKGGSHQMGGYRVGTLQKMKARESEWVEECRFVSPVDAYRRALRRLRSSRRLNPFLFPNSTSHSRSSSTRTSNPRAAHLYSQTGHLLMSPPPSLHPIPQLLALGEKKWEEMLAKQSTTLGEAVKEYRRRYGRRPPKGFDDWWNFAQKHALLLPDEYDRIHMDLAPFFALPAEEFRRRILQAEAMNETFILEITGDGRVELDMKEGGLKWEGTWLRAVDAASLLRGFAKFLPPMRAVFSIFDQPQIWISWARRNSLVELGLRGQHTKHLKESDDANVLWSRSCAPESNLRKHPRLLESHSLIYDSTEASDLCANPYLLNHHGLTVESHGPASNPKPHTALLPLFSLAKTSINSDILITPLDQFADKTGKDPKWEDKSDSRLVWRGSSTGISWMNKGDPWRKSHRFRLHEFANGHRDTSSPSHIFRQSKQELYVPDLQTSTTGPLAMTKEMYPDQQLKEFYFDMQLSGKAIQCNETDGCCDEIRSSVDFAPFQESKVLNQYKFMFDVDGNGWSGRFRRLMSTNSVVLKAGIFTEWFQPHLIPWFMYIPTRLDYEDLPMIMAFLRGTPKNPEEGFDEVAKALAQNGKCFVQRMFRVADLQAYMFRLFLEYARLAAADGEDRDFYYDEPEEILDDEDILPISRETELKLADIPAEIFGVRPKDKDWSADGVESVEKGEKKKVVDEPVDDDEKFREADDEAEWWKLLQEEEPEWPDEFAEDWMPEEGEWEEVGDEFEGEEPSDEAAEGQPAEEEAIRVNRVDDGGVW